MSRVIIIVLVVMILINVPSVVVADGDNTDAVEIRTWINGDLEQQEEEIRAWIESDDSSDYPDLRDEAVQYLNNIENQREQAKGNLSGDSVNVSENLKIVGYEFDTDNETAKIVLETDETTPVSVQDFGSKFDSSSNSYSVQSRTVAGVERIEINSKVISTDAYTGHAVDIFDGSNNKGYLLKSKSESSDFFESVDGYMVGISAFMGALTLSLLSIFRIRNREQEGVNELIPLQ